MKHELITFTITGFAAGRTDATSIIHITVNGSAVNVSDHSFSLDTGENADASLYSGIFMTSDDANWGGISSLIISDDMDRLVGVSDAGMIIMSSGLKTGGDTMSVLPVQVVKLNDPSSGVSLGVESIATLSGLSLVNGSLDGFYVLTDPQANPLLQYNTIASSEFNGIVFNGPSSNPLMLGSSSLTDLVTSCLHDAGLQSIESLTPEASELIGDIIYMCESPSSVDGNVHGWVYDPSSGESNTFMIEPPSGWALADLAFCRACMPSQVFFLSKSDTGFAVDTVALDALLIDGNLITRATDYVRGLVRLLNVTTEYKMASISVIPDASNPPDLLVFVSSDGSLGKTVILSYQVEVLPAGSAAIDSDNHSLSILILLLLLVVGILVPIAGMLSPSLRAKFERILPRTMSVKRRVLFEDSDEDSANSPPPLRGVIVDRIVGKSGRTITSVIE